MNGCVIPHTPIAVDFWKLRDCPRARVFFLTHLHGDHIAGLTSSWNYPVYCSEVTATLLKERRGVREDLICPLQLDASHIVYLDKERTEQMTVTLIDANHCPGAVMFLFEGYFGTILHTGDFRFKLDMITQPPLAQLAGKIDTMYLDNTYNSWTCCFPSREEATKSIIAIIESHPTHDIVLGLRNLGKEDLLCKIALECHEWISVPAILYQTLQLLNAPDVFVRDDSSCRIRVVAFHIVSNRYVRKLNETRPTIVILPTSIYCGIGAKPYENQLNIHVVPYSDHSSYMELTSFVSHLKPSKIIPVVKAHARGPFGVSIADRADMSGFDKYLTKNISTTVCIPETIARFMKSQSLYMAGKSCKGVKRKSKQQIAQKSVKIAKCGVIYDSPGKNSHEVKHVTPEKACTQVAEEQTSSRIYVRSSKISSQEETNFETHTRNKVVEMKYISEVEPSQGFNVNQQLNEMFTCQSQGFEINDTTCHSLFEGNKLLSEKYVSADEDTRPDNDQQSTDNDDVYETASEHSADGIVNRKVSHIETSKDCKPSALTDSEDQTLKRSGECVIDKNEVTDNRNNVTPRDFGNVFKLNQSGNNLIDRSKRIKPTLDLIVEIGRNETESSSKGIIDYFNTELAKHNRNNTGRHSGKRNRKDISQTRSSKQKTISDYVQSACDTARNECCKTSHIISSSDGSNTVIKQNVRNKSECQVNENNENQQNKHEDICLSHPGLFRNDDISVSQILVIGDSSSTNCTFEPIDERTEQTDADDAGEIDAPGLCTSVSRCRVYIRNSNSNFQIENTSGNDVLECENEANDNSEKSQSLLGTATVGSTIGRTNHMGCMDVNTHTCEERECDKIMEQIHQKQNANHNTHMEQDVQNRHFNLSNRHTSVCNNHSPSVSKSEEIHSVTDTNLLETVCDPPADKYATYIESVEDIHVSDDYGLINTVLPNIDKNMNDIDILFETRNSSDTDIENMTQTPHAADIHNNTKGKPSENVQASCTGRKFTFNVIGVQFQTDEFKRRKFYKTLYKCISQIR